MIRLHCRILSKIFCVDSAPISMPTGREMSHSTCPLCGFAGDGFRRLSDDRRVCPRCGELSGGETPQPVNVVHQTRAAGLGVAFSGLITLALSIGWMAVNFAVGPPLPQPLPGQDPGVARATQLGMRLGQIGPPGIGVLVGVLSIAGGVQLARRRMWGLAAAGAFAGALPCTCGFPVGLPIGIWALVVLANPSVRESFR